MDAWVWVLIGFGAGLVVAGMLRLIFRKDPTAELEQAADEKGAQLSKAEMKAAILQERLHDSETSLEEQRAAAAADCQEKLDAVEAEYREKIDILEKQFADLDVAFAAQLSAKEEEKLAAAAVAAGLAVGTAVADEQPPADEAVDEIAAWEMGPAGQSDLWQETAGSFDEEKLLAEMELEELALPAAAVVTTAALEEDDSEEEEVAAAVEDEADAQTAVVESEEEDDNASALAKATFAASGVAVAAAVLNDDEEEDEDDPESGYAAEAAVEEAAIAEETEIDTEADEAIVASAALADGFQELSENEPFHEEVYVPGDESDEVDEEEDSRHGLAAAGAAAALLATSGDEEEDEQETEVVAEADGEEEDLNLAAEVEQDTAVPDLEEELDDTAAALPEVGAPVFAAAAAGIVAEAADEDDAVAFDEPEDELTAEVEEQIEEEPQEPAWPEDTSIWQGEYFNNMNLEGEPVLVREDVDVDFDWGMESPAPEVNADGFSARWTRTADLPPGLYRFTVTSDDGARLFVNERMVISAWYDHTEMTFRREIELPGGPVDLRLEYYENAMAALIRISWERIG